MYNNKTHTSNRFFTVEMPAAEIAHSRTQPYGKIAHLYRFESKSSVQSFLSSNFATLAARLLPYSNGSAANAEQTPSI